MKVGRGLSTELAIFGSADLKYYEYTLDLVQNIMLILTYLT